MKIISTVGTSLFENFIKHGDKKAISEAYNTILKEKDFPYSQWNNENDDVPDYCATIKTAVKNLAHKGFWGKSNISAEILSIIKICAKHTTENIEVHLIATDTVLSVLAAELICEWFNRADNGHKPTNLRQVVFSRPQNPTLFTQQGNELYVVSQLRVNEDVNFQIGFLNLIQVLDKLGLTDKDILNITGGYKAIIPIMTLYGQLKAIPLNYIYDESELGASTGLVEVGNLPINFDWARTESLKPFLGIKYHRIWTENNGMTVATLLVNGDIEWDKSIQLFKAKTGVEIDPNHLADRNRLLIFNELFRNKLILFNSESGEVQLSVFGVLFQKVQQIENYRGLEMEYIFAHYFHKNTKDPIISQYCAIPPDSYSVSGSFKVQRNDEIVVKNEISNGNGFREIGDVDITLMCNNIYVLGEIVPNRFNTCTSLRAKNLDNYGRINH